MPRQILTKEKIIETGIELIETGEPLTFSTIAKSLGSRSQALYTYFANVNELKYAIVAWTFRTVGQQVQDQLFGQSGIDAIVVFAQQLRTAALHHERLSRFVLLSARTTDYEDMNATLDQVRHLLHQLINRVFEQANVRTLASRCIRNLIVGDVINVEMGWFTGGTMLPEESFETLLRQNIALLQTIDSEASGN